jgi:hypothetical protein
MMRVDIDLAGPADDAAIRLLMRRQSMPGRVTVTFEREPDFFLGCAVTGEDPRVLVARSERGEVVGVACRSWRNVFLNGREHRLGYLGQLRIDERFRGRWLVSRGFSLLRDLHESSGLTSYLAAIVDGNREAKGVLVEKRRRLFPEFHAVAEYCTLAIDVHRARPPVSGGARISAADACELPAIAQFLQHHGARRQFFPVWHEGMLRDLAAHGLRGQHILVARCGEEIVGVMALWDQSAYKQTVIKQYSGWLKAVSPIWNRSASMFGRSPLPRPGDAVRSAYAALVCVADDDLPVFSSLLREIYRLAHARNLSYVMLGLDARDPLLPTARAYPHILYPSRLYLAEWADGDHLHERLEPSPAYVDIATL